MILQDGQYNGRQILSAEVAQRIKTKKNFEQFNRYYNDPWYEKITDSYHDQWWGFAGVDAVAAWEYTDNSSILIQEPKLSLPNTRPTRKPRVIVPIPKRPW